MKKTIVIAGNAFLAKECIEKAILDGGLYNRIEWEASQMLSTKQQFEFKDIPVIDSYKILNTNIRSKKRKRPKPR